MKDQLIFDTTETADSDNVGAYVRSSDGTLIDSATINAVERLAVDSTLKDGAGTALTSTLVSGDQALDVNVVGGVNVEVDLSHLDDSIRLGDGTSFFTSTTENGDIALDVHLSNTSIAVTATQLDIDDLTFASDKVDASGSTLGANSGVDIGDVTINNAAGAAAVNIQDGGNSITVDAVDLDIRNLDHAQDDIRLGDGTTLTTVTTVGADNGLDVYVLNDPSTANTAIATAAETLDVANTAQNIIVAPLADRKSVFIYNNDNRQLEIGATGFSVGAGFPISPGAYMELKAGSAIDIEYNSPKINHEIRTMELS